MSKTITASTIIRRIRRKGDIRLAADGHTIEVKECSDHLRKLAKQEEYCVRAWLREERTGTRSPSTDWYPACTCSAYEAPHNHRDPGPPANFQLNGADPFDALKELVRKSIGEQINK